VSHLAKAIRDAAKKKGVTLEALREEAGISNGRFYELLAGAPPKKLDAIRKLEAAGVQIPPDIAA
jgi:transcriptional regulator with XRE-family HTH domain